MKHSDSVAVYGRTNVGYRQPLCHCGRGTWASEDFTPALGVGVEQGGSAGINPLQIPRDDCIFTFK